MAVYCTPNAFFHYFIDFMAKHYYDRKSEKSSRPKHSNTTTFKGKYGTFSNSQSRKTILPDFRKMIDETIKEMTSPKELMSPSSWELSRLIAERKKSTESNLTSWIIVAFVSLLGLYVFVKLCELLLL